MNAHELGYRIVPIVHAGEDTGFVKIIRLGAEERELGFDPENMGQFVHIATKAYVLLPNETVQSVIDEVVNDIKAVSTFPRFYKPGKWQLVGYYSVESVDVLSDENVSVGFVVTNSMNGTLATDVRSYAYIGDFGLVLSSVYKHKHTANLVIEPDKLANLVANATAAATEYMTRVSALKNEDPQEWLDVMEKLTSLPERYLPVYLHKKALGGALSPDIFPPTLWEVYVSICKDVWMSTSSEATKIDLFDKLNAAFSKVVMVKRLIK